MHACTTASCAKSNAVIGVHLYVVAHKDIYIDLRLN